LFSPRRLASTLLEVHHAIPKSTLAMMPMMFLVVAVMAMLPVSFSKLVESIAKWPAPVMVMTTMPPVILIPLPRGLTVVCRVRIALAGELIHAIAKSAPLVMVMTMVSPLIAVVRGIGVAISRRAANLAAISHRPSDLPLVGVVQWTGHLTTRVAELHQAVAECSAMVSVVSMVPVVPQ
jgi:hypothetical protein